MKSPHCPHAKACGQTQHPHPGSPVRGLLRRWFWANSLIAGVLALIWLLLRSGSKPSRFAYPCQQAAFSAATLAFGVPLVAALIAARRRVVARLGTPAGLVVAALGVGLTAGLWSYFSRAAAYTGPRQDPPADYRARVFHVTDCPRDPVGDRFVGLENLITLMGGEGLKFYQSADESPTAGPEGIIATDDVVIIKINYQWDQRGGTNTDVLSGLIRAIVDHPDTFAGEIVVCENAQFESTQGLDRDENNAQDHAQSPHDVVVGFQAQGHNVSQYDWTEVQFDSVEEYSDGDTADGYVVYPYDSQLDGRVSYPKFQTADGTYISLKYGIWDPDSSTYDRQSLKFINVPVLKSHGYSHGATACVKHYMGVVTGELDTNSHDAIERGILGALLAEIRPADLNILDCIWVNANPVEGPWTEYDGATRRDELVASVDPVAADIWAVTNILIPAFEANGESPPWPTPSADPDDPASEFRVYLDNSMNQLLDAGYAVTNNLDQIVAVTFSGPDTPGDTEDDVDTGGIDDPDGGDDDGDMDDTDGVDDVDEEEESDGDEEDGAEESDEDRAGEDEDFSSPQTGGGGGGGRGGGACGLGAILLFAYLPLLAIWKTRRRC